MSGILEPIRPLPGSAARIAEESMILEMPLKIRLMPDQSPDDPDGAGSPLEPDHPPRKSVMISHRVRPNQSWKRARMLK